METFFVRRQIVIGAVLIASTLIASSLHGRREVAG